MFFSSITSEVASDSRNRFGSTEPTGSSTSNCWRGSESSRLVNSTDVFMQNNHAPSSAQDDQEYTPFTKRLRTSLANTSVFGRLAEWWVKRQKPASYPRLGRRLLKNRHYYQPRRSVNNPSSTSTPTPSSGVNKPVWTQVNDMWRANKSVTEFLDSPIGVGAAGKEPLSGDRDPGSIPYLDLTRESEDNEDEVIIIDDDSCAGEEPIQGTPEPLCFFTDDEDEEDSVMGGPSTSHAFVERVSPEVVGSHLSQGVRKVEYTPVNGTAEETDDEVQIIKEITPSTAKSVPSTAESSASSRRRFRRGYAPSIPEKSDRPTTSFVKPDRTFDVRRSPQEVRPRVPTDYRSPSLAQCVRLEEKERFRRLLQRYSPSSPVYNKSAAPLSARFSGAASSRGEGAAVSRLESEWKELKSVLDELTTAASPTGSVSQSVVPEDDRPGPSSRLLTGQRRTFPKSPLSGPDDDNEDDDDLAIVGERLLGAWQPSRFGELSRRLLDANPTTVAEQTLGQSDHARSEGRRKEAERLRVEVELRKQEREFRQRSVEDDVRLRMRLEGLVLPVELEPEPEPEPEKLIPLTADQESRIDRVLVSGAPSEVLVERFNLTIHRSDLHTLVGLNWLNDEVIFFYINLLLERSQQQKGRLPSLYSFNTFFYPKLVQGGHSSLKRWTRRIDLFGYDLLLVPVHLGAHWCLAVIDFRKKEIQYYDSMGGDNQMCLTELEKYLKDEHFDKKKQKLDTSDWKKICLSESIPHQMNGSDCGMFLVKFAEYVSSDAPITFTQDDMPYFRRRMILEILDQKLFD